jgi:replicative DNA helicase
VNAVRDYLRGTSPSEGWSERNLLEEAKEHLRKVERNLLVVYRPNWTIDDIEFDARARAAKRPIGAILVDYLQRIPPPRGSYDRRDIEVSAVARRLKSLAVDLKTPAITGAQINREAAKLSTIPGGDYEDKEVRQALKRRRPQLHHLREGGSEQEADLVLGLMNYRADFEEDSQEGSSVPAVTLLEIGTLKNRCGTPGRWAPLAFAGRYGMIRNPGRYESL